MDSPERLQRRIDTVEDLQVIVRTMKALSAVSIRQYEQAVRALDDYYRAVEFGLQVVLPDTVEPAVTSRRRAAFEGVAAIVFGTDHGLCGHFNEDIAAFAAQRLKVLGGGSSQHRVLAVGVRAGASLGQAGLPANDDLLLPGSAAHITATVQEIIGKVDAWRSTDDIRRVYLFYNRQPELGGYEPTQIDLLPVDLQHFRALRKKPWPSRRLPTFTMDRESLLSALLSQYFFISIFRACAESQASEHASRLAAMQSAEKNLDEKHDEIKTLFRRLRQESITTELLDVVSGYEAVMAEPMA